MNENEPGIFLNIDGDSSFEATRDNSSLFRHIGAAALYDHIFIVTDEDSSYGTYVFRSCDSFEMMSDYMIENGYPIHLNIREPAQCDVDAFERMILQACERDGDFVPEDWNEAES